MTTQLFYIIIAVISVIASIMIYASLPHTRKDPFADIIFWLGVLMLSLCAVIVSIERFIILSR